MYTGPLFILTSPASPSILPHTAFAGSSSGLATAPWSPWMERGFATFFAAVEYKSLFYPLVPPGRVAKLLTLLKRWEVPGSGACCPDSPSISQAAVMLPLISPGGDELSAPQCKSQKVSCLRKTINKKYQDYCLPHLQISPAHIFLSDNLCLPVSSCSNTSSFPKMDWSSWRLWSHLFKQTNLKNIV